MQRYFKKITTLFLYSIAPISLLAHTESPDEALAPSFQPEISNRMPIRQLPYKMEEKRIHSASFTGKILSNKTRLRLHPTLDSPILKELDQDAWVVVTGEKDDFYLVEPPKDLKAYIFRTFVINNVVEGVRVNVRLRPELGSPVVCHLNTGDLVEGVASISNNKWLEIDLPKTAHCYIAKELIENIGGPVGCFWQINFKPFIV